MIRNLKALGLALCAVFALSAVAASGASAGVETDLFTTGAATTHLTGIQTGGPEDNVFGTKSSAVTVQCEEGIYKGTTGATAESVTVKPEYKKCTGGGFNATVDVNPNCAFILTGTTDTYFDTNNVHKGLDATASLECSHNGNIRITAALGCTITFSDTSGGNTVNQNRLGVKYTNGVSGGKWDVKVDVTVDNIHYTTTESCGFFGLPATGNDGFLTETVTVKGYSDAAHTNQVDVTVS